MKIHILGSGVAASQLPGIPNRYPPGYVVEWGDNSLLLECGEAVRFRLEEMGFDYGKIEHLAVSHSHPDHYALPHFMVARYCKELWSDKDCSATMLQVYCPDSIAKNFFELCKLYVPDEQNGAIFGQNIALHPMSSPAERLSIGNGTLSAENVRHGFGNVQALAFRLETPEGVFAYSGDTGECAGIRNVAKEANIFLCECSSQVGNNKSPKEYGHLNPYLAGDIAKEAGVKKMILTHYTGLDADEKMIQDCRRSGYEGDLIVAKDLDVYEL